MSLALGALACPGGQEAPSPQPGNEMDYELLVDRLRQAGAEVRGVDAPVSQPFFSVQGRALTLEGEAVQVFEYDSVSAVVREAERVSLDGTTIGAHHVDWVAPPHFFRSGRLIVLYVGTSHPVQAALEAVLGPTFAGSGRGSGSTSTRP